MISFGKYYHIMAKDVEYVEALKVNSDSYPYHLTVYFRSGHKISITKLRIPLPISPISPLSAAEVVRTTAALPVLMAFARSFSYSKISLPLVGRVQ